MTKFWPRATKFMLLLLLFTFSMAQPLSSYAAMPEKVVQKPKTVLILMLHNFTADPSKVNYTTIEMNRLESQLLAYQRAGYQFVSLSEADTVEKPAVISIDDGYQSVYTHFYPMAKRMKIPFNLNVIMNRIGGASDVEIPKCQLAELQEMKASGLCQIGIHSFDAHGFGQREGLVKQPGETWLDYYAAIRKDTELAIQSYKSYFGEAPTIYAYPYGKFSDYTYRMIKEYGFVYSLTTMTGVNRMDERYTLKRINLN